MQNARKNTFQSRYKKLVTTFVTGGTDPVKASLSIAFGFLWGVFPLIGTSTLLCTVTSFTLKLNLAIIQAINYLVYPLQIALLIPYFYVGSFIMQVEVNASSLEKFKSLSFTLSSLKELSGELSLLLVSILVGWLVVVPAISLGIYAISKFVLSRNRGFTIKPQ